MRGGWEILVTGTNDRPVMTKYYNGRVVSRAEVQRPPACPTCGRP